MNTINFREGTVAFPLQQWLHERSTMVRYKYIAYIVIGYIRTFNFTYTGFCMWPFSYVTWSAGKLLIYYVTVFLIDFDKESFTLNVSIIKLQEASCIYKYLTHSDCLGFTVLESITGGCTFYVTYCLSKAQLDIR
jgi:hypothetical protein